MLAASTMLDVLGAAGGTFSIRFFCHALAPLSFDLTARTCGCVSVLKATRMSGRITNETIDYDKKGADAVRLVARFLKLAE